MIREGDIRISELEIAVNEIHTLIRKKTEEFDRRLRNLEAKSTQPTYWNEDDGEEKF